MQPFLQLVAHDLYTKIGNDLSRTVLVFPNKRANLFFNEYLAEESDQPIWSPAAMSISDLLQKLSVQKAGDPIRLVCELYKVFKEETESRETLDDFYFWGELLISDFDDVDKNMVDADKLFSNLQDLKNRKKPSGNSFRTSPSNGVPNSRKNSYPSGTNWVLSIIVIGRSLPNLALPTKVCSTGTLSNNSIPTGSNTINTYSSVSTY